MRGAGLSGWGRSEGGPEPPPTQLRCGSDQGQRVRRGPEQSPSKQEQGRRALGRRIRGGGTEETAGRLRLWHGAGGSPPPPQRKQNPPQLGRKTCHPCRKPY